MSYTRLNPETKGTTNLASGVWYAKQGNMVVVTLLNAGTGTLGTLPEGYRPAVNIGNGRGVLGMALSGYDNIGYIAVYTDGRVTVSANSTGSFTGQVSFSTV